MIPGVGETFAGYKILAECGQGAYGSVFLVEDALGKRFALKYVSSVKAGEYEMKGLRNYMSMEPLSASLIQISHCGFDDGCLFYVMEAADNASDKAGEYVPDTLAERLSHRRHLTAAEALDIANALLCGLEALHNAGMLHRDIKPENIVFVNRFPKLADPGLIRHFDETISFAGTPGYLAPELVNGAKPSPCTDIYALGKVIYRIVTGLPPENYPEQPSDVPIAELYQICRPLMRLCNSNPSLRCQNCQEARVALPRGILEHGMLLRLRDRIWLQADFRRKIMRCAVVLLIAVLAVAGICFGLKARHDAELRRLRHEQELQTQLHARRKSQLADELSKAEAVSRTLDMQLEHLGEKPRQAMLNEARVLLDVDRLEEAAAILQRRQGELSALAEKHIPPLADDGKNTAFTGEAFREVGLAWGYLASPLGMYLSEKSCEGLASLAKAGANRFAANNAPRLGGSFSDTRYNHFNMSFVPPGCFFSPVLQSVQCLDYPYWMLSTEVSAELYTFITHSTDKRNLPAQGQEFLSWNDHLFFCRRLNESLRGIRSFPPGYAIRMPTEAEWEFAAVGGWANMTPPKKVIQAKQANVSLGTGEPNALGIFNIDDNLSEVVMPYPEKPAKYPGAAVYRGANLFYGAKHTDIAKRASFLLDQNHARGIGFRPVLAPTSPNYYKEAWYRGPEIKHVTLNGKVYTGFTTVLATVSWSMAVEMASFLGASLPTCDDLPHFDEIYRRLELVASYPCHLAVHYSDGAWRELASNAPVKWTKETGQAPMADGERKALCATAARRITAINEKGHAPVFLLRWDSQEAFERRTEVFMQRAVVHKFEMGGRRFAVCRFYPPGYALRPFARFLGLKQLVLDKSSEYLAELASKVLSGKFACALGPIRFYEQWEQADGTMLNVFPEPEKDVTIYDSMSLVVLASHHGKLVQTSFLESFLVELP